MALLEDIAKLQFGAPMRAAISGVAAQAVLSELQAALEEQRVRETQPIPVQEATEGAVESVFPGVNFYGLPDLMRQLDRSQKMIKQRQEIYGKFIPALALLNPALARVTGEEQLRGERALFEPLAEKADLISKMAGISQRSEEFRERSEERAESREQRAEEFGLRLKEMQANREQLSMYRQQLLNQRSALALDTLARYDKMNDNLTAIQGRSIQLLNALHEREADLANIDQNPMILAKDKESEKEKVRRQMQDIGYQLQLVTDQYKLNSGFMMDMAKQVLGELGSPGQPSLPAQYNVGTVYEFKEGRFKYLGGNEKDPKSWQKAE